MTGWTIGKPCVRLWLVQPQVGYLEGWWGLEGHLMDGFWNSSSQKWLFMKEYWQGFVSELRFFGDGASGTKLFDFSGWVEASGELVKASCGLLDIDTVLSRELDFQWSGKNMCLEKFEGMMDVVCTTRQRLIKVGTNLPRTPSMDFCFPIKMVSGTMSAGILWCCW